MKLLFIFKIITSLLFIQDEMYNEMQAEVQKQITKKDVINEKRIKFIRKDFATQDIEIQLIEKSNDGFYFYDHNAEIEPKIFVDIDTIKYYGLQTLKLNEFVNGIFDESGLD